MTMSEENTVPHASAEEKQKVRLPETKNLILSPSPHIQVGPGSAKIMCQVIVCLIPAIIAALVFFGLQALRVLVICTASCAAFEYLWCLAAKRKSTVGDFSAVLTGLLLGLNISSLTPAWVCIAGSFIAVIIAKQVYGGLGQNPFNPAAVGRIAMLMGASGAMTQYAVPRSVFFEPAADALTSATPLSMAESAAGMGKSLEYFNSSGFLWRLFIGETAGSLGETSVLAVLIGGIGLMVLRLIRWQIPVSILATVAVFVSLVNHFSPGTTPGVLFHLFTGGLMLGAFFMATDMVTSPVTVKGGIVFGVGIGILVCVIRIYGSYPEGVSFAIVLMNALVPLIDKFCYIKPFGHQNIKAGRIEPRRGEIK